MSWTLIFFEKWYCKMKFIEIWKIIEKWYFSHYSFVLYSFLLSWNIIKLKLGKKVTKMKVNDQALVIVSYVFILHWLCFQAVLFYQNRFVCVVISTSSVNSELIRTTRKALDRKNIPWRNVMLLVGFWFHYCMLTYSLLLGKAEVPAYLQVKTAPKNSD